MFLKKSADKPVKAPQDPAIAIADAGPCQKTLRLRVGLETISPVRSAVIEEFRKRSTLPGFRKGKAPTDLVAQRFAEPIQEETVHRVTRQTLEHVVKTYELKPVGPIELRRADFNQADGLMLEATVEVEPAFQLTDFKNLRLTRQPATVSPEEVEQSLTALQESMAQLVPVDEGQPRPSDPGSPATEGRDQPKERRVPALDDELAKDLGFQTLAKLREHVEAKLREQKRQAQRETLENALYDELLKRHEFALPAGLVSRQLERVRQDFKARLLLSERTEGQVEEELEKFSQRLRDSAARHVKLGFILDRIAAQETLTVTEPEVVGRLWQVAQRWRREPAEVRRTFDEQGLWPSVISTIRQEKTVAHLLASAVGDEEEKGGTA